MLPIPCHIPKINPTNPTQSRFGGGRLQQVKWPGHGQDKELVPCPHPAPSPRADTHSMSDLSFPAVRFPKQNTLPHTTALRAQITPRLKHRNRLEKGLCGRNSASTQPQTVSRLKEPQWDIWFHWGILDNAAVPHRTPRHLVEVTETPFPSNVTKWVTSKWPLTNLGVDLITPSIFSKIPFDTSASRSQGKAKQNTTASNNLF